MQIIVEDLLGRPLTTQDGIAPDVIAAAEHALGRNLPAPLAAFYRLIGNLPQFTDAFQEFATPTQVYEADGLLMFLEENQGVCSWGTDTQDRVFQCQENDRYDTGLCLQEFLNLMLQYQVAQGSEFSYSIGIPDDELADLLSQDSWEKTVDHNGLVIHRLHSFLIWFLHDENRQVQDDIVFFSSLTDPPDALKRRYRLEEL